MASVSIEIQKEWYKIFDTLYGWNHVRQNVPLALEMAATCAHPEAQWLAKTFKGKHVKLLSDFEAVLVQCDQNDAHRLCFLALCYDRKTPFYEVSMRQAAEKGLSLAQARYAACRRSVVSAETSFKFATLAAKKNERYAFYILGLLYSGGDGCERNDEKAMACFLRAANFGEVWAMVMLGRKFEPSDIQRWKWWGRAAKLGKSFQFIQHFARQVKHGSPSVVFVIGQTLQGYVDFEKRIVFEDDDAGEKIVTRAKQAIDFYKFQLLSYRKAVDAWTLVGMRWRVVKDIRKLIGSVIWNTREEALYDGSKILKK